MLLNYDKCCSIMNTFRCISVSFVLFQPFLGYTVISGIHATSWHRIEKSDVKDVTGCDTLVLHNMYIDG